MRIPAALASTQSRQTRYIPPFLAILVCTTVAARRLGLLDKAFTAVLGGGVLAARHPLLHDAVVAGIQSAAPKTTISIVADPPVAGAALLALDAFGGTGQEIEAAVRAAVRAATG